MYRHTDTDRLLVRHIQPMEHDQYSHINRKIPDVYGNNSKYTWDGGMTRNKEKKKMKNTHKNDSTNMPCPASETQETGGPEQSVDLPLPFETVEETK